MTQLQVRNALNDSLSCVRHFGALPCHKSAAGYPWLSAIRHGMAFRKHVVIYNSLTQADMLRVM